MSWWPYCSLLQENRVKYNQSNYRNIFKDIPDEYKDLQASEAEASLSECIQQWLERTPGLEEDGFNFPKKFEQVVNKIFDSEIDEIEVCSIIICDHFFLEIDMFLNINW